MCIGGVGGKGRLEKLLVCGHMEFQCLLLYGNMAFQFLVVRAHVIFHQSDIMAAVLGSS